MIDVLERLPGSFMSRDIALLLSIGLSLFSYANDGGLHFSAIRGHEIEVAWRDGVPVHHMRVGREELLHSRKCLAQLVEQLAQVIASLSLGGVWPEEEGKMLALLRNIAMQHEIGEQ